MHKSSIHTADEITRCRAGIEALGIGSSDLAQPAPLSPTDPAGLSVTLLFGLSRLVRHSRRREIVIALLALIWVARDSAVVVLVAFLLFPSGSHVSGRQLLFSGGAALLTNAIAFGVAFWEPRWSRRSGARFDASQAGLAVPTRRKPATGA